MDATPVNFKASKPVYWLVVIVDADNKASNARWAFEKVCTPREAAVDAYGSPPTSGMRFFNLTSKITEARKLHKQIVNQYQWVK